MEQEAIIGNEYFLTNLRKAQLLLYYALKVAFFFLLGFFAEIKFSAVLWWFNFPSH